MDPIKKSEAFTLGRHFAGCGRLAMIRLLAFTVPVLLLAASSILSATVRRVGDCFP